jgi:hypothetical protein
MQRPRPARPAGTPDPGELPARLFRGLYQAYDLHVIEGVHVAVPKGTPCFASRSLGHVARQISERAGPGSGPASRDARAAAPARRPA